MYLENYHRYVVRHLLASQHYPQNDFLPGSLRVGTQLSSPTGSSPEGALICLVLLTFYSGRLPAFLYKRSRRYRVSVVASGKLRLRGPVASRFLGTLALLFARNLTTRGIVFKGKNPIQAARLDGFDACPLFGQVVYHASLHPRGFITLSSLQVHLLGTHARALGLPIKS